MTTHIQQRSNYDCGLAAIAMAVGKDSWNALWTEDDLESLKGKGMADSDFYLDKAGIKEYKSVYTFGRDSDQISSLLWKRRALLSIKSLNVENSNHMVYWDGSKVHDPQQGRGGQIALKILASAVIDRVILLP
jgi:hypothetical protein